MIADLYDHLELESLRVQLVDNLNAGFGIAHHADADGVIAAYFARVLAARTSPSFRVQTDQFDLAQLVEEVAAADVGSLSTFDVNVFSVQGALARLASRLEAVVVYDDHLGATSSCPENAQLIELLPSPTAYYPGIRPPSLFCYALLESVGPTPLQKLLVVAAAIGEGVAGPFRDYLPRLSKSHENLAREIGRGINAFFTAPSGQSELLDLLSAIPDDGNETTVVSLSESDFLRKLREAELRTSALIDSLARPGDETVWFWIDSLPVHLIRIEADRRVVNLVASNARNKLKRGIMVTAQETRTGVSIELRRTNNLSAPDLAACLLDLPPDYFVSRGGHPMAAGATIKTEYLQETLDRLQSRLQEG